VCHTLTLCFADLVCSANAHRGCRMARRGQNAEAHFSVCDVLRLAGGHRLAQEQQSPPHLVGCVADAVQGGACCSLAMLLICLFDAASSCSVRALTDICHFLSERASSLRSWQDLLMARAMPHGKLWCTEADLLSLVNLQSNSCKPIDRQVSCVKSLSRSAVSC
jgi:hypothetical protein